jgi:DNA-binding phage protein
MIATRVAAGTKATKAIKEVAKETGLSRQELYSAYHQEE